MISPSCASTRACPSEIELHRSESLWREAEVDIAQQTRRVALDRNALALLVGEPLPPETGRRRADTRSADLWQGTTRGAAGGIAGAPSGRARRRTCAQGRANANIGAARAAFFPSIELTGFYGNASDDLSALFQAGHTDWSFVPQVRLPIFSGGANKAGLDLANVRKSIEDRALRAVDPGRVPRSGRRVDLAPHARGPIEVRRRR